MAPGSSISLPMRQSMDNPSRLPTRSVPTRFRKRSASFCAASHASAVSFHILCALSRSSMEYSVLQIPFSGCDRISPTTEDAVAYSSSSSCHSASSSADTFSTVKVISRLSDRSTFPLSVLFCSYTAIASYKEPPKFFFSWIAAIT